MRFPSVRRRDPPFTRDKRQAPPPLPVSTRSRRQNVFQTGKSVQRGGKSVARGEDRNRETNAVETTIILAKGKEKGFLSRRGESRER